MKPICHLPWTFLVVSEQLVNERIRKALEFTSKHSLVNFIIGHMNIVFIAVSIKVALGFAKS